MEAMLCIQQRRGTRDYMGRTLDPMWKVFNAAVSSRKSTGPVVRPSTWATTFKRASPPHCYSRNRYKYGGLASLNVITQVLMH